MTTLNDLRWKKFSVLNDGFVCLVDAMGDDASVVQAARVSYGKDNRSVERQCPSCSGKGFHSGIPDDYSSEECETCNGSGVVYVEDQPNHCSKCGSMGYWAGSCGPNFSMDGHNGDMFCLCGNKWNLHEKKDKDRTLIRYLMRHRHTTPFEMAELKFLVRVPMDCWRQWIRHRTASVNEYSTRYTEAIDSQQTTLPGEWRLQSGSNKQGSSSFLEEWSVDPGDFGCFDDNTGQADCSPGEMLSKREAWLHNQSKQLYQDRLALGIAREQSRKDLPLSTYTEAYWKIDLHNLLHFLSLRMDSHAQLEIRQYATTIGEQIVKPLFPTVWEAFQDYRMNAMFLTALDIQAIKTKSLAHFTNKREREECQAKLSRLGIQI